MSMRYLDFFEHTYLAVDARIKAFTEPMGWIAQNLYDVIGIIYDMNLNAILISMYSLEIPRILQGIKSKEGTAEKQRDHINALLSHNLYGKNAIEPS